MTWRRIRTIWLQSVVHRFSTLATGWCSAISGASPSGNISRSGISMCWGMAGQRNRNCNERNAVHCL